MEDTNVSAPAEAVAPEPQSSEPVQNTQVQETPTVETQTEAPLETTNTETVSEPQTEVAQETPQQSYPEYDITQYLNAQTSTPDFTPDENGYIDPKDFYNRVMQDAEARIEQKLKFQESERKLWQQVESRFPEIKEDSELRDILNAQRIADVASGGKGDLNKIADKLLGKIQSYQQKGKAQAQVSEKVQKSAALESNTANTTGTGKSDDLMERMSRGDQGARDSLISQWLSEGKI